MPIRKWTPRILPVTLLRTIAMLAAWTSGTHEGVQGWSLDSVEALLATCFPRMIHGTKLRPPQRRSGEEMRNQKSAGMTGTFTFGSGPTREELDEIIRQSLVLWGK